MDRPRCGDGRGGSPGQSTALHCPPSPSPALHRLVAIMVTALSLAAGAAFVGSRAYAQSTAKLPALAQVINQKNFNVLKDPPPPLGYNASSVSGHGPGAARRFGCREAMALTRLRPRGRPPDTRRRASSPSPSTSTTTSSWPSSATTPLSRSSPRPPRTPSSTRPSSGRSTGPPGRAAEADAGNQVQAHR